MLEHIYFLILEKTVLSHHFTALNALPVPAAVWLFGFGLLR
jgi:hypothetical protein